MTKNILITFSLILMLYPSVNSIPQADLDLFKGFFNSSNIKEFFNLTNCETDLNYLMKGVEGNLETLIEGNQTYSDLLLNTGQILIHYSNLLKNCEGFEKRIKVFKSMAYQVYTDPQQFLSFTIYNLLSFHVISKIWSLSGKIDSRQFDEVGKTFGDIFHYVLNVEQIFNNTEIPSLSFIGENENIITIKNNCIDISIETFKISYSVIKDIMNKDVISLSTKIFSLYENIKKLKNC